LKHFALFQDVPDDKLALETRSPPNDAPRLIIFYNSEDDVIKGSFITADGVASKLNPDGGVCSGLFHLLLTYYIFNLDYPKNYSQVLGLLQHYVMQEPFTGKKTAGYVHLSTKLHKALSQ
jgi:hypothetical protein